MIRRVVDLQPFGDALAASAEFKRLVHFEAEW